MRKDRTTICIEADVLAWHKNREHNISRSCNRWLKHLKEKAEKEKQNAGNKFEASKSQTT